MSAIWNKLSVVAKPLLGKKQTEPCGLMSVDSDEPLRILNLLPPIFIQLDVLLRPINMTQRCRAKRIHLHGICRVWYQGSEPAWVGLTQASLGWLLLQPR